jgi:hypothetical protein
VSPVERNVTVLYQAVAYGSDGQPGRSPVGSVQRDICIT